jgi:hypothetical protein
MATTAGPLDLVAVCREHRIAVTEMMTIHPDVRDGCHPADLEKPWAIASIGRFGNSGPEPPVRAIEVHLIERCVAGVPHSTGRSAWHIGGQPVQVGTVEVVWVDHDTRCR